MLVVADRATRAIGEALRDEAAAAGADAVLTSWTSARPTAPSRRGRSPRRSRRATCSSRRRRARSATRPRASGPRDEGARGATMPGVTEDMLARVMAVDFDTMAARSRAVAALLDRRATRTCHLPARHRLHARARRPARDPRRRRPDARRARSATSPAARGSSRRSAARAGSSPSSLAPLGISASEPATLTVREGRIVAAEGGLGPRVHRAAARRTASSAPTSPSSGSAPTTGRRLTGNVLEDEKILGTVHVAFGASAGIGGTVSVPIHLDVVVLDATLDVDGRPVLDARPVRARRTLARDLLLAVPNVSEGRDADAIDAIAEAFADAFDARLLDVHSDPDHHRTVFTLAGEPGALARGACSTAPARRSSGSTSPTTRASTRASARSTSRRSSTCDDADRGAACAEALVLADLLGDELELPVFLYGVLADGRTRAELRRGGPAALAAADRARRAAPGLRARGASPDRRRGARRRPPAAGRVQRRARAAGDARGRQGDRGERSARAAPRVSRPSGRSGCGSTQRDVAQVSTNVEDHRATTLATVVEAIAQPRDARLSAELVGLAPRARLRRLPGRPPGRADKRADRGRSGRSQRAETTKLRITDGPDQAKAPHQAPRNRRRDDRGARSHRPPADRRGAQEAATATQRAREAAEHAADVEALGQARAARRRCSCSCSCCSPTKGKNRVVAALRLRRVRAGCSTCPAGYYLETVPVPPAASARRRRGKPMIDVRMFTVGPVQENCFIVRAKDSDRGADRRPGRRGRPAARGARRARDRDRRGDPPHAHATSTTSARSRRWPTATGAPGLLPGARDARARQHHGLRPVARASGRSRATTPTTRSPAARRSSSPA